MILSSGLPLIRSWLFAPGNVPRFLERAFATDADAVVLDLEDAVPPGEKDRARELVSRALDARAVTRDAGPLAFVRVNGSRSPELRDDLAAVVRSGLAGLRVPKVETADEVVELDARLGASEQLAGLPLGSVSLVCGIESALGVLAAASIAGASPRVLALSFGAADFAADVGLTEGPARRETLTARSMLVLASRAAGIRPPIDSVHVAIDDAAGLERTTHEGRSLGFFGRSAIHPAQLPIINRVFSPSAEERSRARAIIEAAGAAAAAGSGSFRLSDGTFVDRAIVRQAELLVRLAERSTPDHTHRG